MPRPPWRKRYLKQFMREKLSTQVVPKKSQFFTRICTSTGLKIASRNSCSNFRMETAGLFFWLNASCRNTKQLRTEAATKTNARKIGSTQAGNLCAKNFSLREGKPGDGSKQANCHRACRKRGARESNCRRQRAANRQIAPSGGTRLRQGDGMQRTRFRKRSRATGDV